MDYSLGRIREIIKIPSHTIHGEAIRLYKETADLKEALKAAAKDNARLNGATCLVQDEHPCPYGDDSCKRDGEKMAEECNYRYYIDEYATSAANETQDK